MTAAFEVAISEEEITKALADFTKAKAIRKQAEKMEQDSRAVILAYYEQKPEAFFSDPSSEKSVILYGDGAQAKVTFPQAAPIPAHVEDVKALREKFEDIFGTDFGLFEIVYTFDLETAWPKIREIGDRADDGGTGYRSAVIELIEQNITPEQPGKLLAPRVSYS